MDPITVLATAKAAAAGISTAIKLGKDVSAIVKDMSTLMKAEGDLARLAADPPRGWGQKESAEEIALKAFAAKREAEEMRNQVKNELVSQYGITAWEQIQSEIVRIRKAQKEAARKEAEARAEHVKMLMWVIPSLGIPIIILIIIIVAIIKS
jgi:hypothetical protein